MGCVQSKRGSLTVTTVPTTGKPPSAPSRPPGQPGSREDYYGGHGGRRPAPKPLEKPQPMPKPEDVRSDAEKEVLKVVEVDFNIATNSADHHTEKYELTTVHYNDDLQRKQAQLVVRRGDPFDITIKFDRAFDKSKDDIKLIFTCGPDPRESKGTQVNMLLSDADFPRKWGAKLVEQAANTMTMRVFTPPRCPVAKWNFLFDTVIKHGDGAKIFRYTHPDPIYILFNAWNADDAVFMDDEAARQEFVLNDKGRVYRGTSKQISAKPWNFGQFEDFVLDCVMHLLDKSELSYQARGDAVKVVRKISAITNSPDDSGVLVGNWSGDYSGGVSPLFWAGSVRILQQYWKTLQPVSFGQCWVFSGVVTTICRALGIPARSVTNFASAHDSDASITIDDYWDHEGNPLSEYSNDSVWNFHVWNDVWMARSDLPPGFGGWQAIDATPQELSDGVYCAGPCSLEAIKNGLVNLPYDAPFIFAEVNADRVHWIRVPGTTEWKHVKVKHSIGKFLSTKSPDGDVRMDVTRSYKYEEDSQQERTAVWRAIQEGSTKNDIYEESFIQDMTFDLIEREDSMFGEPFDVTMKVTNEGTTSRSVRVTLTATVVYYTGVPVRRIKMAKYTLEAPPNAAGEVTMSVSVDEYLDKLVDMCNIKISCMAMVIETSQYYCESDDFRLRKPDLDIKAPLKVKVGEEYEVKVSFKNPLPRALTKCEFSIEGAGLQKPLTLRHDTIGPHGEGSVTTKLKAVKPGEREIVGGFDSKEISDLAGSAKILVEA